MICEMETSVASSNVALRELLPTQNYQIKPFIPPRNHFVPWPFFNVYGKTTSSLTYKKPCYGYIDYSSDINEDLFPIKETADIKILTDNEAYDIAMKSLEVFENKWKEYIQKEAILFSIFDEGE